MAFITIGAGQTDANSPVDVLLMDTIRTNLDQLNSDLVTNGNSHDHAGGDGAQVPIGGITANAIAQSKLKTSTGSVSVTVSGPGSGVTGILPGGYYGFIPNVKTGSGGGSDTFQGLYKTLNTSYTAPGALFGTGQSGSITMYAEQIYVTASPPYKVGGEEWGHFLYLLVNAQGDVISAYEAEDPPYAYNGPRHNPKDSIERIQAVPHPFSEYFDKDPSIDGLEIVMVDLRGNDTKKWKEDNEKKGKVILEDLGHINKGGKIVTPQELGIKDIKGFTDKVKIRKSQ
jgi:hypothetical protein